jgi:hypothetical protein
MGFCAVVQHVRLPMHHQKELRIPTSTTDFILISEIRNRFLMYLVLFPSGVDWSGRLTSDFNLWHKLWHSGTATFLQMGVSSSSKALEVWIFPCFKMSSLIALHVNSNVATIVSDRPCHAHHACFSLLGVIKRCVLRWDYTCNYWKMRHTFDSE